MSIVHKTVEGLRRGAGVGMIVAGVIFVGDMANDHYSQKDIQACARTLGPAAVTRAQLSNECLVFEGMLQNDQGTYTVPSRQGFPREVSDYVHTLHVGAFELEAASIVLGGIGAAAVGFANGVRQNRADAAAFDAGIKAILDAAA